MNFVTFVLIAADALPQPPQPTASPEVDVVPVIAIVLVALGAVVLVALALRPLVVKAPPPGTIAEKIGMEEAEPIAPPAAETAIIPFPPAVEAERESLGRVNGPDSAVGEHLRRTEGGTVQRRSLGDRQPTPIRPDIAVAEAGSGPAGDAQPADVEQAVRPAFDDRAPEWHDQDSSLDAKFVGRLDPVRPVADPGSLLEGEMPGAVGRPQPETGVVDRETVEGISATVRELIFCANVGELLHGFALYSDAFLFRFMDATGMTDEEFRNTFGSVPGRPMDEWTHLGAIADLIRLADGRVEATVSYRDIENNPANGQERFRFVRRSRDGLWMIDDISPLRS